MVNIVLVVLIAVVLTIANLLARQILFPFVFRSLAERNLWFTLFQEGRAKAVMAYNQFNYFVMAYEGHAFDVDWNIVRVSGRTITKNDDGSETIEDRKVVRDADGEILEITKTSNGKTSSEDTRLAKNIGILPKWLESLLNVPGGLRYIVNPFANTIYTYTFRWTSFRQADKEGKPGEVQDVHKESIDYIIVQDDVYFANVKEAETKEMIPVNVDLLLAIRAENPYKALFRVEEWLEVAVNRVKSVVRHYIGTKTYEQLRGERKETPKHEKDDDFKELIDYLHDRYGIRIKQIGFVNIDPAGARALKYIEAASKSYEAEQEALAVAIRRDAESERAAKVYDTILARGDRALAIRFMEDLETASNKQGNVIITLRSSV
ncbi:MAG: SPFH domain-containing protein, partial [Patescibacteria group bacterium]